MLSDLRPALVLLALLTVLTGVVYPFAVLGIGNLLFPAQAGGSLIVQNGQVVGSTLIGQNFTSDRYFHGRPSATTDTDPADATKTVASPYNAASSAGSNAGPTSKALIDRVTADAGALKAGQSAPAPVPVPVDLVTTSASGLDPDITPAAALFQVARVAKARGLGEPAVRRLVMETTEERTLGFLGERRVNVLNLNRALDGLK